MKSRLGGKEGAAAAEEEKEGRWWEREGCRMIGNDEEDRVRIREGVKEVQRRESRAGLLATQRFRFHKCIRAQTGAELR